MSHSNRPGDSADPSISSNNDDHRESIDSYGQVDEPIYRDFIHAMLKANFDGRIPGYCQSNSFVTPLHINRMFRRFRHNKPNISDTDWIHLIDFQSDVYDMWNTGVNVLSRDFNASARNDSTIGASTPNSSGGASSVQGFPIGRSDSDSTKSEDTIQPPSIADQASDAGPSHSPQAPTTSQEVISISSSDTNASRCPSQNSTASQGSSSDGNRGRRRRREDDDEDDDEDDGDDNYFRCRKCPRHCPKESSSSPRPSGGSSPGQGPSNAPAPAPAVVAPQAPGQAPGQTPGQSTVQAAVQTE
ncbi:hypothetical protein BGZ94_006258, partial [Podila epigama]